MRLRWEGRVDEHDERRINERDGAVGPGVGDIGDLKAGPPPEGGTCAPLGQRQGPDRGLNPGLDVLRSRFRGTARAGQEVFDATSAFTKLCNDHGGIYEGASG